MKEYANFKGITVGAVYKNKNIKTEKVDDVLYVLVENDDEIFEKIEEEKKKEEFKNFQLEKKYMEMHIQELHKRVEDAENREKETKLLLLKSIETTNNLTKQLEYKSSDQASEKEQHGFFQKIFFRKK